MIWEGTCQICEAVVEFKARMTERDAPRTHAEADQSSACTGPIRRRCFPTGLAVRWKYGPHDKTGCFMGPTNHVYKTDTTEKARRAKTRVVSGASYSGPVQKDRA